MAVINRHRAMVELAREGACVETLGRQDAPVQILCDGKTIGHLRWTTFRALLEAGTLVEVPRGPGQLAGAFRYVLSKEA